MMNSKQLFRLFQAKKFDFYQKNIFSHVQRFSSKNYLNLGSICPHHTESFSLPRYNGGNSRKRLASNSFILQEKQLKDKLFPVTRNTSFTLLTIRCASSKAEVPRHRESGLPLHDPEKGDLVYVGELNRPVKGVKLFSLSSSVICLAMQPWILPNLDRLPTALQIICGVIGSYFIVFQPILIHWLVYRYVSSMYYNRHTETFTSTRFTFIGTKKHMKFKVDDIKYPDSPTVFSRITAKGVPLFLEKEFFLDISAFEIIMKYNKEPEDSNNMNENVNTDNNDPTKATGVNKEEIKAEQG